MINQYNGIDSKIILSWTPAAISSKGSGVVTRILSPSGALNKAMKNLMDIVMIPEETANNGIKDKGYFIATAISLVLSIIVKINTAMGPRKPTRKSKKPTAVLAESALSNKNDIAYKNGGLAKILMTIRIQTYGKSMSYAKMRNSTNMDGIN